MKSSNLTTAVLCILSSTSFAQNYQTVQSNSITFFITTGDNYFLANRIDQVENIAGDSTFYPFQSIREDELLAQNDPCKYYLGHSWMGEKIEILGNGLNVFYNLNNEAITIETQAALNDSFNVFNYENGDWINGVVSSILEVSIFGEVDSVKIIDLYSNVTLNLANPRFLISKNHGFVELFAPYSFPEPYQGSAAIDTPNNYPIEHDRNFSLVGQDTNGFSKPTIEEIYDYSIGDIHQFTYSKEVFGTSYMQEFKEIEIINKFIWNGDSIVYFITKNGYEKSIDEINQTTEINEYPGELESYTVTELNQWQNDNLPEEFNGTNSWTSLFINDCGDVEERVNTEAISWSGSGSCLDKTSNPYSYTSFIKGVGKVGPNETAELGEHEIISELVFYQRSNGNFCGTKEFLSLEDNQEVEAFSVYPNPAQQFVQITTGTDFINGNLNVYDKMGRVVITDQNFSSTSLVDIENLVNGLYHLQLTDGLRSYSSKMIVQH
jgi:hypothetical protein